MIQMQLNDLLRVRGYVSLNEALELLGFERTVAGGMNGWIRDSREGDGYIYFGVWDQGLVHGKDWIRGDLDVMTISFNVDRSPVSFPRRVKKYLKEGKV